MKAEIASMRRKPTNTGTQRNVKNDSFENVLARLCEEIERSHDLSREIKSLTEKKPSPLDAEDGCNGKSEFGGLYKTAASE